MQTLSAPDSPTPSTTAAATRNSLRHKMPIVSKWAYFDHAAVAPLCGPARDAIRRWCDMASEEGDTAWLSWDRAVETTRCSASRLINASPNEIALVPNTTAGINLVAEGLDWRDGDNVVVFADEFPSNLYPWLNLKRLGVETRLVPTDRGRPSLDRLREACDKRTRVVSLSWVGYATGYRLDLDAVGEIVRGAGGHHDERAYFLLDAIQGLGVLPLNVRQSPIDFLAADGHKWLLGPEGAGIAYIASEHLEGLRPQGIGWHSVTDPYNFSQIDLNLRSTAARFEGGSANMPGMHALGASLALLLRQDPTSLEVALLEITDYLCERLTKIGAEVLSHRAQEPSGHDPRSGIVVANPPAGETPDAARLRCLEAGCVVSSRAGRLRLSPHAYTTHDEVDRLVDVLAE